MFDNEQSTGKVSLMPGPRDHELLAQLDDQAFDRLRPFFEVKKYKRGDLIYAAGESVKHVYFPVDAVVGVQYALDSGETGDVAILDHKLCGPLNVIAGGTSITSAVVLHAGHICRLPIAVFMAEIKRNDTLLNLVLWTFRNTIHQMSVASVCMRKHPIENLCAVWLLVSAEATRSNKLHVTHSDIAQSIGVRREAVTMTLKKYAAQGLIEQARGHVHVVDKQGLQRWTCNCIFQWYQARASSPTT